ncbi:MAG TPA: HAD family hydrolase [Anaerolineales bacterium]|nr:HAD family hydrolase [Anaerolineales bacterium]
MDAAIFLDRDGVLTENKPDYVRDWSQVEIIQEAIRALSIPAVGNYKIVIVTNQSAVGRGLISLEAARGINSRLVNTIRAQGGQVDAVYMCPHSPAEGCLCRKPQPGLLLQAVKELSLDLQRSWMIGDAWSDLRAGQSAGVRRLILLRTGRGAAQSQEVPPDDIADHLIFDNLHQALIAIFAMDQIETLDTGS